MILSLMYNFSEKGVNLLMKQKHVERMYAHDMYDMTCMTTTCINPLRLTGEGTNKRSTVSMYVVPMNVSLRKRLPRK